MKISVLVSCAPDLANFNHAAGLVEAAINRGFEVYLYCIDEAVRGIDSPLLQGLVPRGLRLYACAYSAERRRLPRSDQAIFSGLALLSDLIANTDRFVSFN